MEPRADEEVVYPVTAIAPMMRERLMAYAMATWHGYRPAAHHRLIASKLEAVERGEIKRLMIFMPPRHGKQIADDVPVLTDCGWVKHGELKAGNRVFGVDGNLTKVLAVGNPAEQDCEVIFTDGATIPVHENHEWTVYDRASASWKTVETRYLEKRSLWNGPTNKRGGRATLQLPERKAINLPEVELPLHPYVLGVWLGDGRSSSPDFCWAKNDECVADSVHLLRPITRKWTHATTGVVYGHMAGVADILRNLKVLNNKHIPDIYILSGIGQRLELLAGLIDTDGHVEEKTQRVRIATVSDKLADGMEVLIRSLGWRANRYTQLPAMSSGNVEGKQPVHYVSFTPGMAIPTRLPRKRISGRKEQARAVGIADVRRSEKRVGRCIQVDAKDGLYLVGKELVPTHNSALASEYFPAWYLGRNAEKQMIHCTYAQDFADDLGLKVRNQIADPMYQEIFPGVELDLGSRAAGKFNTTNGGVYRAVGAGGPITGRGAHLLLIDDPIKGREDADSETMRRKLKDWYGSVAYTRLMPQSAVIIIQTRWHADDLSGWLLKEHRHEHWEVLSLPAIDERGAPLWPEAYPLDRLLTIKKALGARDWAALYQQQPTIDGGNILKRKWWRWWPDDKKLPKCDHVFTSWDTAYSDADMKGNAHSACTVWGVFWHEADERNCLMLLKTWHGQVDYPELRKKARELDKEMEPDCHLIEKKASGQSLVQDLRRIPGVRVRAYNPDRDKVTRAYSVQAMLESGQVFAPNRQWAEALVDWVAQFPNGTPPSADFTDTVTQALLYLRNGWWLEHPDDKLPLVTLPEGLDDEDAPAERRTRIYG